MIPAHFIAFSQYGTKGLNGVVHNKQIIKYFEETGHAWVQDDETAWCAAFVNWCLLQAGKKMTGKLNARSFLTYGTNTDKPKIGDIVVFWRISRNSPYGHVGFYISETKDHINVLGGNQSNSVNITPFSKSQLLGYRRID